jgi:nitrite reductase/ring-hydroxylating ferredoxin subunit
MTNRRTFVIGSAFFLTACAASETASEAPKFNEPFEFGKLSEIPIRSGKTYEVGGQKILITRPSDSEFRAFLASCTHQGGLLSDVQDDVITCPIHGAQFSAVDGAVLQGPADRPLVTMQVSLAADGDTLVVS